MIIRIYEKVRQTLKEYICILLSWRSILTFGFCSIGILLYFVIQWDFLQITWAKLIILILDFSGFSPLRHGDLILLEGISVRIGSNCTYMPLILAGLPFIWRGDSIMYDIFRILFFVMIVTIANTLRICLTLVLLTRAVSWKYAHDLINHLTYLPITILIFLFWFRALKLSINDSQR